ncbi:MAG: hypothetical protein ACHQ1H_03150, partial [Nitrososphaerales archaeon]
TTERFTSILNDNLTVTRFISSTASGTGSVVFYQNYRLTYPANQQSYAIQTFQFANNGYIALTFQSTQSIHWQLLTYQLTETSPSNSIGGLVDFPVNPGQSYTLLIVNDACGSGGCGNSFGVNMTLMYHFG